MMKRYHHQMRYASFPLGGIGTGTISLHASGHFHGFQLFNRPSQKAKIPYSFFCMHTRWGDQQDARVVEAEPFDFYEHSGIAPMETSGLPRFPSSNMTVCYPFARIDFQDPSFPFKVKMEAFTPFIPTQADDSGIPASVFFFDLTNNTGVEAEVLLASSMWNIHGYHGEDGYRNVFVPQKCWNEAKREEGVSGLFMTGNEFSPDDLLFSNNAILTPESAAEICEMWNRRGWFDGLMEFWTDFEKGILKKKSNEQTPSEKQTAGFVGTVGVRKKIQPGQTVRFTFVWSWYVPNRNKGWFPEDNPGEVIKNYYATRYSNAWHAGKDVLLRLYELEDGSRRFAASLRATTLPESMRNAIESNIAILRSTTCWRDTDGTLIAWEGSLENEGSCFGTCTHVWNYAQTAAYLFPSLEQSARLNEFLIETESDGKMAYRARRRFGLPAPDLLPAIDGQLGTIMRAWREWKLGGDRTYLRLIYPSVIKAFDFCMREWDRNGDGVPEGVQHNTYDIEFYNENPLSAVLALGAMQAVKALAMDMQDTQRAERMNTLFQRAQQNFEKCCWNGAYYRQNLMDPDEHPHQFGNGCLSDQLLGQTFAYLYGLGPLLPEEHLKRTARSIYQANFLDGSHRGACLQRLYVARDEKGLVLCTWPANDRPQFPFVYSGEVWTGVEYQVATLFIYLGMQKEAMEMIDSVRKRFDGVRRNPWNENECGFYYVRAMASWGLLIAFSGFDCHVEKQMLHFAPKQDEGRLFWSMGTAWGVYTFHHRKTKLRLQYGSCHLKRLELPLASRVYEVRINQEKVAFSKDPESVNFEHSLFLKKDDELILKLG